MPILYDIFHHLFSFIVILTVIVFVHEFGHYFIAKISGVKVTEFSIGFGKKLWGVKDKSGTEWKISLWPLGGYVKMFGDEDPSSNTRSKNIPKEEEHKAFHSKSLPVKAAIVSAGPLANFLFAIIILTGFFLAFGKIEASNEISLIAKNSPAEQAGLLPHDKITAVDGYGISDFSELEKFIASHPDIPLHFTIKRGEKIITKIIKPKAVEVKSPNGQVVKIGKLGIATNKVRSKKLSVLAAIKASFSETVQICYITLKAIGQIVVGTRGTEEMGGPIKIAKMASETTKMGVLAVLWFMAMLSINLGLINLLPIPVLDGGHLLFYIVEAFFGKNIALKVQNIGLKIGFTVLILLMAFVIINDIRQF